MNTRNLQFVLFAASIAAALPVRDAAAGEKKNVLVFSLTKGFRHSSIDAAKPVLKELAEQAGYNCVVSDDPAMFDPDKVKQWNCIIFNNASENVFPEPERRKALMDQIKAGAGFMAIHGGIYCFLDWPEFGQMLNGRFVSHPWTQRVKVNIEDPNHPLMKPFGGPKWEVDEEVYQFKDYKRSDVRVLMSIDTTSIDLTKGERKDGDYAMCWIRNWEKGRVFYTAHGHNDGLFKRQDFQQHLKLAMQWACGDLNVDTTPSKELGNER